MERRQTSAAAKIVEGKKEIYINNIEMVFNLCLYHGVVSRGLEYRV